MKRMILVIGCLIYLSIGIAHATPALGEFDFEHCNASTSCTETAHASSTGLTVVVPMMEDSVATDRDVTGCTKNGVAMTRYATPVIGGNFELDMFYILDGTAGNVVCSLGGTGSTGFSIYTATYTGVASSSTIESTISSSSSASDTVGGNLVTTQNDVKAVIFYGHSNSSTSWTPDGSQNEVDDRVTGTGTISFSDLTVPTATTQAVGAVAAASGNVAMRAIGIAPEASARRRAAIIG